MTDRIRPIIDIESLTPEIDALGGGITLGTIVRSFDFATMGLMSDGTIGRTEQTGDYASYVEGEVIDMGQVIEGCPRYQIRVISQVVGGEPYADFAEFVFPPVNGTPTSMGNTCAGVFNIQSLGA